MQACPDLPTLAPGTSSLAEPARAQAVLATEAERKALYEACRIKQERLSEWINDEP